MRARIAMAVCCLFVLGSVPQAAPAPKVHCQKVHGKILWTVIPSPNDPFGRVLGTISGSLHGVTTDIVTSLAVGPDGVLTSVNEPIFMLGKNDLLYGSSNAEFSPVPGEPDLVRDTQTITITGGTGKYAGATGTIHAEGFGFKLFPAPEPGVTYFKLEYRGEVCRLK